MELKDKLKDLRTKANLTQEDLANQLFVSRTLISKWENGERYPNKENIARICVFFQVSMEDLIGGKKELSKYNKYNVLSIIFSLACLVVGSCLLVMLIIAVIEWFTLRNGWTGMGGFIFCMMIALPIMIPLFLFEIITLKKKNGFKSLELYSLFSVTLIWLVSIPIYLFMI